MDASLFRNLSRLLSPVGGACYRVLRPAYYSFFLWLALCLCFPPPPMYAPGRVIRTSFHAVQGSNEVVKVA